MTTLNTLDRDYVDRNAPVTVEALSRSSQTTPDDLAAAARARLKSGRNEPCPCGRGRKYKKCCLTNDETLVRNASLAAQTEATALPPPFGKPLEIPSTPKETAPRPLSEAEIKRRVLWDAFDLLTPPTVGQMDDLLGNLLALPPDGTEWDDVIHLFAHHNHPELPAVFRRIASAVPHTQETGMALFYWAAAEEFVRKKLVKLLPEVAAGFCKLDSHTYDADALAHLEDYLLASHFDVETLQLAEHFLPAAREGDRDGRLLPHAVPEMCGLIFHLRVGLALCSDMDAGASSELLAETLRRDIEEEINAEAARRAATMICDGASHSTWTRADFELVKGDIRKSDVAWQDCLRLYDTLMGVARESWQSESISPGCGFRILSTMLESAYVARDKTRTKPPKNPKRGNLLGQLDAAGLDERLARSCRGVLGVNVPRALLMLEAHELLLRFAERHQLISVGDAAATHSELIRLRGALDV
jgi:hypothetical protein